MRKILVLDDQLDSLTALQAILEYRGYGHVIPVSDPHEAMRIVSDESADGCAVDFFVCDIVLRSSMTGAETAFLVHQTCPDLPILFTSGTALEGLDDADFETLNQLLAARVDFLQKPFTATQLVSVADRLLSARGSPPEFARALQRASDHRQTFRKHSTRVRRAGS